MTQEELDAIGRFAAGGPLEADDGEIIVAAIDRLAVIEEVALRVVMAYKSAISHGSFEMRALRNALEATAERRKT